MSDAVLVIDFPGAPGAAVDLRSVVTVAPQGFETIYVDASQVPFSGPPGYLDALLETLELDFARLIVVGQCAGAHVASALLASCRPACGGALRVAPTVWAPGMLESAVTAILDRLIGETRAVAGFQQWQISRVPDASASSCSAWLSEAVTAVDAALASATSNGPLSVVPSAVVDDLRRRYAAWFSFLAVSRWASEQPSDDASLDCLADSPEMRLERVRNALLAIAISL